MAAWGALKEESPDSYFVTITWVLNTVQVYPHLRELSFPPPRLDMHALLEHELIATKFGTEFQKNGLRPYMTSYTKIVEGKPIILLTKSEVLQLEWHLVNSIRIYGSFEVLASGAVALVDIPGFGDANKARTKRTEEYLKTAEVVILVADISGRLRTRQYQTRQTQLSYQLCVNNACNLIHPRDMINPAREAYLSAILSMQREFCGTFKGLLRKELEDNYHVMASEFGPGMFQRMKDLNEMQFGAETAEELYAKLVERVMTSNPHGAEQG
ncbi:hypothetical protein BD769DRAFT_1393950 [Suillus cothurnatus]|nr:hypothetical protein BD769DRAFT_1393950 [Suillus cothurnatus]